jgi:RNA polymerase sigma-70 factor, ECF subfamily
MADAFRNELIALMPRLRAYAIAVTGGASDADDLVQDTLVRAWRFRDSYQPGSNMKAWVFKILRNTFYTAAVGKKNTVQDVEGKYAAQLSCNPDQEWRLQYGELVQALDRLPVDARDALLLVVGSDMSYEEAAEICGCPVGTMKSRVNRARERLAALMDMDTPAMRRRALRSERAMGHELAPFAA